jgi:hypothetical protein
VDASQAQQPISREATLDEDGIRDTVRRNMASINSCYSRSLAREPTLIGKLALRFTIERDGSVHEASVLRSRGLPRTLELCVTEVFEHMVFPRPAGNQPTSVTYPLAFVPPRSLSTSSAEYRPALALSRPELAGHVDACFSSHRRRREVVFVDCVVSSDGAVSSVVIAGLPPASRSLERCIRRRFEATTLPKHDASSPIEIALEL